MRKIVTNYEIREDKGTCGFREKKQTWSSKKGKTKSWHLVTYDKTKRLQRGRRGRHHYRGRGQDGCLIGDWGRAWSAGTLGRLRTALALGVPSSPHLFYEILGAGSLGVRVAVVTQKGYSPIPACTATLAQPHSSLGNPPAS